MDESFKDHPQSIGEIKSEKSADSADWTPRETLIHMLRVIDSGEVITETLVVCFTQQVKEKSKYRFFQSSKNGLISIGLIESCKTQMISGED